MDPLNSQNPKLPFKITKERLALLVGGTLVGALAIVFGLKLATPIVKKACQSILEAPDMAERAARVASVEAIVLKPGTISKRITTVGKLKANESVTLRTEMQGRIKEIAFKEGTMVKKGDVLIRFEDEETQAQVVKAEADIEFRQARYNRMQALQAKGLTKGPEFDQERGGLNMAKAELEVAKAKLSKTVISAPFDGKIGLIDVSAGAFVDSQKELVTLVDFDPMKIDFKIPEKFIHDIGAGQTAEVRLDSFPDQIFQATVEAVDSRVDPQTHSIAVRATIPNPDGKLQTGLFGSVSVIIGVKNDALLVPESALGREGEVEYVWVVTNGKAGRKRVLTGTKENGKAEITAGLRADEIIITSGQLKLGEGMAVKITNMGDKDLEVVDEDEDSDHPKAHSKEKGNSEAAKEEPAKAEEPVKNAAPAPEKKEAPAASATSVVEEGVKATPSKEESPKEESPKEESPKEQSSKETPPNKAVSDAATSNDTKSPASTSEAAIPAPDATATQVAPASPSSTSPTAAPEPTEITPPATAPESSITVPDTAPAVITESKPDTAPTGQVDPQSAVQADTSAAAPTDTPAADPAIEALETPGTDTTEPSLGKVSMKLREEPVVDSQQKQDEKPFFARSRDYVVNLFKRK
jgi:membrane fusion protein (multidrug efflux system)